MKCEHCNGDWEVTSAGVRRCIRCPRGAQLKAADEARSSTPKNIKPVVTTAQARSAVAVLATIPKFHADPVIRGVIGEELRDLCHSAADAIWLAQRMVKLYDKWPGPREMRRVYAASKIPHDGVMPAGISKHYPDGIPAETQREPEIGKLLRGAAVTADRLLQGEIASHAGQVSMPLVGREKARDGRKEAANDTN